MQILCSLLIKPGEILESVARSLSSLFTINEHAITKDVTKTGNGEWGMGNGEWGMGNGKWGMGNGKLKWKIEYFLH